MRLRSCRRVCQAPPVSAGVHSAAHCDGYFEAFTQQARPADWPCVGGGVHNSQPESTILLLQRERWQPSIPQALRLTRPSFPEGVGRKCCAPNQPAAFAGCLPICRLIACGMAAHVSGNQCAAVLNKSQCIYTKCYCEENVYWLVHKLAGLPIPASVKALLQQQQCATVKHGSPASADDAAPPATASASTAAATATAAQASSPSSPSTRTPAAESCSISRPPADPVAELSCLWVVFVSNPAKQVRCSS